MSPTTKGLDGDGPGVFLLKLLYSFLLLVESIETETVVRFDIFLFYNPLLKFSQESIYTYKLLVGWLVKLKHI